MPYSVQSKKSGKTYYLHSRRQQLKGGHVETLYFFCKQPGDGAVETLPSDREIWENPNTGLPLAKKKAGKTAKKKVAVKA